METTKNIGLFENERATGYDSFVQKWIPYYAEFIQLLPALLQRYQQQPLLVVGSGTGSEIQAFKQVEPQWSITGIDLSPQMVAQAREKLKGMTGVELLTGEVKDMPRQAVFGASTLILVLHFVKDDGSKLALLQEIAARLETGAPLIIKDIYGDAAGLQANLALWYQTLSNDLPKADKQERFERIPQKLHYIPEERLAALLVAAGFEVPTRFYQQTIYGAWITYKA